MKSIIYTFIAISLIAVVLVFGWFKEGYILGVAEGGVPFYDLTNFYNQVSLAWSDSEIGLGFPNGIVTAYSPTFYILSLLEKLGISNFFIQAGFFWLLLVFAGVGIILFTKELFPQISRKYLLIAALFYWFNLISLVNIWNRFLYGYIALWALLPLTTAFFLKGISKRNYLYIFAVGAICAIFSLGLSNPVFNIVLWFIFSYIIIFKVISTNNSKDKVFYLVYFFLNLLYFCIVNLWWIGQVLRYFLLGRYTEDLSIFFQDTFNLSTLSSSSKNLGDLTSLFRFLHKSFFSTPYVDWATVYVLPWAVIIEFLVAGIILFFIFKARKNINVLLLGILLISSFYLAKGNNPPFGGLFEFLFTKLTFLQLFRNPFEKFGFIIPLAATPLFVAGLEYLSKQFQKHGLIIYIFSLGIMITFYGYPFWSGLVFTGMFPPTNNYAVGYKVKVPDYYKQANDWLESQGQNFRFIGFPYNGQGVTYTWEKGFQGVEISMWLFSTPNIMFSTTVLYFDQIANQLEELLVKHDDNFYKVMNVLNSRFLMIRSDIDFHERNMKDPAKLREIAGKMKKEGKLKDVITLGKLEFWENPFWSDRTIFVANNLIKSYPTVKLVDFTLPEAALSAAAYHQSNPEADKMIGLEIIRPDELKKGVKPYVYQFDIKNSGNYELLANLPVIKIDGDTSVDRPVLRNDGRHSYGNFNLTEGLHEVELAIQDSDNLVVKNIGNEYTISDFDPFSKYLISFEYLAKENQKINIANDNDQLKGGKIVPYYVRDLSASFSNTFNDIYEPRTTASSIRVFFSPESEDNLILKNMTIKKRVNPDVLLIKKTPNKSSQTPYVAYTKISPTNYKINIKNSQDPFVLIFSSSFNMGWEIIYPDGSKIKNHFLVNAFANGWVIDRLGDYDLTLNFTLQDGLAKDSLISMIAYAGGILIVSFRVLLRKFNS